MRSRRKRKAQRSGYTAGHAEQLAFGHCFYEAGFCEVHPKYLPPEEQQTVLEQMRQAWPLLRQQAFDAFYSMRRVAERPWGWWQFEAPEQRSETETEYEQLLRLGLLSKQEQAAYAEQQALYAAGAADDISDP